MTRAGILGAALLLSAASPAAAERLSVTAGQPLCIDQDSLAAMLAAGLKGDEAGTRAGACEGMRPGSVAEVIERYPSGAEFMRVVKVKVRSPGRGPTTGYTVEVDRK